MYHVQCLSLLYYQRPRDSPEQSVFSLVMLMLLRLVLSGTVQALQADRFVGQEVTKRRVARGEEGKRNDGTCASSKHDE